MKSILFVSHTTDFVKFNVQNIKYFKEKGWKVDYASMEEMAFPEVGVDEHFKIPFSRAPLKKTNIVAYKELKKIIEKNHYDLVHCHTPVGGVIARLASRKERKKGETKVIYTGHGFHFYKGAPIINWAIYYPVEKLMARYSDAVVTINQEDYQLAKRKFHTSVFQINGIGVNEQRFYAVDGEERRALRRKYRFAEGDFLLIYAAELNANKNQKFLIELMPEILTIIPNAKLLLAGKGEKEKEYKKMILENGLQEAVFLLGYRADINKIYQMSDLGISVSVREGFGLNVIEEMACGLPVIVSNNRGHRELVKDGENGYKFDLKDKKDFLDKLEKIYKNCNRESIRKRNIEKAKEYSVNHALKQMEEVYSQILK